MDKENDVGTSNQATEEKIRVPDGIKLEAVAGPCTGTSYCKPHHCLTVGRTRTSKFHIKDSAVSEKHAEINWAGASWTLRDVGSSNGTAVNGRKLGEGEELELKDGDIILFGTDSQLRVEITPIADEDVTVEQYLESECHRQIQRIKARAEQLANQLQEEWVTKKQLLTSSFACAV